MAEGAISFTAKKSPGGTVVELDIAADGTVGDLAAKLAEHESCDKALVQLVCKGAVLNQASAPLRPLAEREGAGNKVPVVYIIRKTAAAKAKAGATAAALSAPATAAPAAPAEAAPAAAPAAATPAAPTGTAVSAAVATGAAAAPPAAAAGASASDGRRVLLLVRHGQCCHEDESDHMKELTATGHQQAEQTAIHIAALFTNGRLPEQRALLHSTSRRARETAAKLPQHLPGIQVWNADLLRETDPTNNPLRAEEVFDRLFAAPPAGASDTLIVVAHNNINLYLLMRAAGVPIDHAVQAWRLFVLRHASITRIDVMPSGAKQIICIGACGHIPHAMVTWSNVTGPDLTAFTGEGPTRKKFHGRMLVLVRRAASAESGARQIQEVAAHVRGLSAYMVSGHVTVVCTEESQPTATSIATQLRCHAQMLPDSITEHPEAGYLQFFCPPTEHSRDTVVMVAEDAPVLYWLLRGLGRAPEDAKSAAASYSIRHASITLVNVRPDGSMKVVTVGDTGHLPLDCA